MEKEGLQNDAKEKRAIKGCHIYRQNQISRKQELAGGNHLGRGAKSKAISQCIGIDQYDAIRN